VLEKYLYDVFGTPTFKNSSGDVIVSSAFANRFLFTGQQYFQQIELYDYKNRMYFQYLGRFLQIDPSRFSAGDNNLYRYVNNSPNNYIDPFGLRLEEVTFDINVATAHIWFRIDDEKCTVEHDKAADDITGWTGVLLGWASITTIDDVPKSSKCDNGKNRVCLDVLVIFYKNIGFGVEAAGVSAGGEITSWEFNRRTATECTKCCCPDK